MSFDYCYTSLDDIFYDSIDTNNTGVYNYTIEQDFDFYGETKMENNETNNMNSDYYPQEAETAAIATAVFDHHEYTVNSNNRSSYNNCINNNRVYETAASSSSASADVATTNETRTYLEGDEYDSDMSEALSFLLNDNGGEDDNYQGNGNDNVDPLPVETTHSYGYNYYNNNYYVPTQATGPTTVVSSQFTQQAAVAPTTATATTTTAAYASSEEDDEANPEKWKERFQQLEQFKKQYGHCNVPQRQYEAMATSTTSSSSKKTKKNSVIGGEFGALGRWVKRQRYHYKRKQMGKHNNLTDDREQALNDIGLEWDVRGLAWEEKVLELKQFVKENGHANVPVLYKKNRQLGLWLKRQRAQYKAYISLNDDGDNLTPGVASSNKKSKSTSNSMTPARIAKLEALGVSWNGHRSRGCDTTVTSCTENNNL